MWQIEKSNPVLTACAFLPKAASWYLSLANKQLWAFQCFMTRKYCVSIWWSPGEILIMLVAEQTGKKNITKINMRKLMFLASFSLQTCYPHLTYPVSASTSRQKVIKNISTIFLAKKFHEQAKDRDLNCNWKFDVRIFIVFIFSSCCTPGIQEDSNRLLILPLICVYCFSLL